MPALHRAHTLAAVVFWNEPAEHVLHREKPPPELNVPVPHAVQLPEDARFWKVPAVQLVQALCPALENVPTPHARQESAFCIVLYDPAAHC